MGKKNKLFEGEIEGLVTGEQKLMGSQYESTVVTLFPIKLHEKIAGLPEEFLVMYTGKLIYVRPGDEVLIEGALLELVEKKDITNIIMHAKKIYNKTLKYGR